MRRHLAVPAVSLAALFGSLAQPAFATPLEPGEVEMILVQGAEAAGNVEVRIGGNIAGRTDPAGKLRIKPGPGLHELVVVGPAGPLAFAEFRLGGEEAAELAIALPSGRDRAQVETQVFQPDNSVRHGLIGVVRSKGATGTPVAGATVRAKGRVVSTRTDEEGNFRLELPRGSYELEVTLPNGTMQTYAGLSASPLITTRPTLEIDVAPPVVADVPPGTPLSSDGTKLDKVVVRAPLQRRTAVAQERLAATVVDTVTLEEIAAAGDSDAGEAFKRVTGVTVQDDVIVVRGLGDRYSSTLLNGAEIPSPNPSRRVVPLDIFPTELLGGLTVQKTYSANLPGDFSGGVALLESRPVPTVNKSSVKLKLGGNSRTTFVDTLTHAGSNGDAFGIESGRRDIPDFVNQVTDNNRVRLSSLPDATRREVVKSLPNLWEARLVQDTPPDFGGSLSTGGRVETPVEDLEAGYLFSGLYDSGTRFRREERNDLRPGSDGNVGVIDSADQERTTQTVDTGLIAGLNLKYKRDHQIDYVSLLSRNTEKSTFFTQAFFEENFLRQDQRTLLDHVESQLSYNQLTGRHRLPTELPMRVRWQMVYSLADRDVRDRRSYTISRSVGTGDGLYRLALQSGFGDLPQREWEFLSDETLDGGVDLELPELFERGEHRFALKTGLRLTRKDRELSTVRYAYFNPGSQLSEEFAALTLAPSPEFVFVDQFFGDGGFDIRNANTQGVGGGNSEAYTGQQDTDAGYVSGEWRMGEQLSVEAGVRLEKSTIDVLTGDPRQGPPVLVNRDETDLLPAINATWFFNKQQQLRFGVSKTLNRPQFRELADVQFLDPETRFISFGNSALRQSEITNLDLRYEHYWSASQAVSVAAFFKDFKNPIEATVESDANGRPIRSFINSPSAIDYGIELDGRYGLEKLASIHPFLGHLYLSGNLSLIESEVDLPGGRSRKLQGQSPYIVNLTLGYQTAGRTEATLLVNIFGNRISEVGFDGLPDAEEQSYPLLDFNLRQTLTPALKASFKARNLLDPEIEVRQGDVVQRGYKLGRSFQLSAEYEF